MSTFQGGSDSAIPSEHRTLALLCHLSSLAAYVVPAFGLALGPLVAWLATRDSHPAVDRAGRNALNFGITMTIASFLLGIVGFLFVVLTLGLGMIILVPLLLALPVLHAIVLVMACIRTSDGELYEYPLTWKFL